MRVRIVKIVVAAAMSLLLLAVPGARGQVRGDIALSELYVTHVIFPTDIVYADLSNVRDIIAKVADESKNVLAISAKAPFSVSANISVMESNGVFHTFLLSYDQKPESLIVDMREGALALHSEQGLSLSELYTSHVIFSTDIVYANVSNSREIVARVVDKSKNTLAVKARGPLFAASNISVMESNGTFHTYRLQYSAKPENLILDNRGLDADDNVTVRGSEAIGGGRATTLRRRNAPLLSEVYTYPRALYHLTAKMLGVRFSCEEIIAYSDVTYITVSIENRSGVSFQARDAMFTVEDNTHARRKMRPEPVLQEVRSSYGSLTAPPGGRAKMVFSFDKITLAKDQVLKIYLYETDGRRNLSLTLSADDVNRAALPPDAGPDDAGGKGN